MINKALDLPTYASDCQTLVSTLTLQQSNFTLYPRVPGHQRLQPVLYEFQNNNKDIILRVQKFTRDHNNVGPQEICYFAHLYERIRRNAHGILVFFKIPITSSSHR